MATLTLQDLEQDQQEVIEKTDIQQLSNYCLELQSLEDDIATKEEELKQVKEKADKIASEIIPNMLAEQGLSSLKLADGSSVEVMKSYKCTIRKDMMDSAYRWLRANELGDLIKNTVSVQFGTGEDTKAEQLLDLAVSNGFEPQQHSKVEPMTLMALYRERVEAGLDMPSDSFNLFVKDKTKISRKK